MEPVLFNFRERRRPDLLIQVPEGEFLISGNPMVDDFGDLLQAEQAILRIGDGGEETFQTALADAQDAINHMIKRHDSAAPQIAFTVREVMELIRMIVGNKSATAEVLEVILAINAGGLFGDRSADEEDGAAAEAAAAAAAGEEASPLPSKRRSRKSSSRSGSAGAGARTGGAKSRGGSSAATAAPPAGT